MVPCPYYRRTKGIGIWHYIGDQEKSACEESDIAYKQFPVFKYVKYTFYRTFLPYGFTDKIGDNDTACHSDTV